MPKTRVRSNRKGGKSTPKRVKNKIGGRKSELSARQMNEGELAKALKNCRKRDKNKLIKAWREMESRIGVSSEHLDVYLESVSMSG